MDHIPPFIGQEEEDLEGLELEHNDVPPSPPPPPYENGCLDAAEVARYLVEAMARVSQPARREKQLGCSFKDFCAHHYRTFDGCQGVFRQNLGSSTSRSYLK